MANIMRIKPWKLLVCSLAVVTFCFAAIPRQQPASDFLLVESIRIGMEKETVVRALKSTYGRKVMAIGGEYSDGGIVIFSQDNSPLCEVQFLRGRVFSVATWVGGTYADQRTKAFARDLLRLLGEFQGQSVQVNTNERKSPGFGTTENLWLTRTDEQHKLTVSVEIILPDDTEKLGSSVRLIKSISGREPGKNP